MLLVNISNIVIPKNYDYLVNNDNGTKKELIEKLDRSGQKFIMNTYYIPNGDLLKICHMIIRTQNLVGENLYRSYFKSRNKSLNIIRHINKKKIIGTSSQNYYYF
jgi:tRNA U38,U39,U40 pseudouridine synthase TruA